VYSTLINLISGLLVYNNTHKLTSPPNCGNHIPRGAFFEIYVLGTRFCTCRALLVIWPHII
jgi:hypothetical protein